MNADVLVVGAGIAGLTVAGHLLDRGVTVTVVERAPMLRAAGAGILLHPNALAHLGHLGTELPATGTHIDRQLSIDDNGTTTLDWAEVWPSRALPLAIHRRRLARLLLDHLPDHTVFWSVAPQEAVQDDDGVTVRFDNGETGRYRLVLGADGVHSWVRKLVDPRSAVRYLGQTYWRTTVRAAAPIDFPEWRVWRGSGNFFGAMPIGGGRMHVFLQAGLAEPWSAGPGSDRTHHKMIDIARTMGVVVTDLVASLDLDEELRAGPALGLSASRWTDNRIAILGDAAHAMTPASSQGGAMAVEDAAVLADEVARHGPHPTALRYFAARRNARVREFTRIARLHLALMESVQFQPGARSERRQTATWFRRLYRPLMEPV